MLIKLTRASVVARYPGVRVGEVFDCKPDVASALISMGRAVVVTEQPEPPKVETREPIVENREPEIVRPKRIRSKLA